MKLLRKVPVSGIAASFGISVLVAAGLAKAADPPLRQVALNAECRGQLLRILKNIDAYWIRIDRPILAQAIATCESTLPDVPFDDQSAKQIVSLLADYRTRNGTYSIDAAFLLIEMGATNQMQAIVAELQQKRVSASRNLRWKLTKSSQPLLIGTLGPLLALDGDDLMERISDDQFVSPLSVVATHAIISILSKSSELDQSVKAWAESLVKFDIATQRTLLRIWWPKNQDFVTKGRFNQVTPLPDQGYPANEPIRQQGIRIEKDISPAKTRD